LARKFATKACLTDFHVASPSRREIFVNSTNTAGIGLERTVSASLHDLARAVETAASIGALTNTGVSTAILASGEILQFSPRAKNGHVSRSPIWKIRRNRIF